MTTGSLTGLLNDSTVCSGTGPDAVYQVSLSSPATLTVYASSSTFTPRVSVRSSCLGTTTLACDPVSSFGLATVTTSALAAGTYFVWVDSSSTSATGSFSLSVTAGGIDAGPGTLSSFSVVVMGQTVPVDQYVPAGSGPFPVIALGHGFSLGKSSMGTLATTLRDDGFVVVVPQFPSVSTNAALHTQMMLASVDWVVDAGIANPSNLGLGGHSAGALSAWLASAQRQTRAVVLLDPLDDGAASGLAQAGNVMAPALWVFAPPSMSCNSSNNAASWFNPKPGRKTRLSVVGATACDPADPVPSTCGLTCGTPMPNRAAVFRRYARAHFGREMLGSTFFPCVDPRVMADVDAGIVSGAVTSLGCP